MQRYINTKQNSRSTAVTHDQNPTQKLSIEFYKIPSKDTQIIFIDSMSGYERLLDRLFKVNNEDQELFIGFDCMLFYSIFTINRVYKATKSSGMVITREKRPKRIHATLKPSYRRKIGLKHVPS